MEQVDLIADKNDAKVISQALFADFIYELFGPLKRFSIHHIVNYKAAFGPFVMRLDNWCKLIQPGCIPKLRLDHLFII